MPAPPKWSNVTAGSTPWWPRPGGGWPDAVELTAPEEARAQLETNFRGRRASVQAVLGPMRGQGGGRVVLLSSIGGASASPSRGLQRQQVRPRGPGRGDGLRGGAVRDRGHPGGAGERPHRVHRPAAAGRRRPGETPYRQAQDTAVSVMERDERSGVGAESVAACVRAGARCRRGRRRRVSVGKSGERIGLLAKRLLPFPVFQAAARSSLGVR